MTYSVEIKASNQIDYTVESATDYYPYGKALRSYGKERYQSTYHERDVESGFDYRGARFYDSDVARFNSLDPLAADFASWSPYNYVLGNPVYYTDPDGKMALPPKDPPLAGLKLSLWLHKKMYRANDVSSRMIYVAEHTSGEKQSVWFKSKVYISNHIDEFGTFSDANDAAVLMNGQNLNGSKATTTDKVLAGIGIFLPIISGGGLKQGVKELISTEPSMQSLSKIDDMAEGLNNAKNQTEFNKKMFDADEMSYPKVVDNPVDGKTYVVDGHHRLQAAEKANTGYNVPVQNVKLEETGFNSYQEMIDAANQLD